MRHVFGKFSTNRSGAVFVMCIALLLPLIQGTAAVAAPTSISMPIKTTSGGQTIGTYTMTMTIRETDVFGLVPSTSVQLPAGHYQLLTCAAAIPATVATASPCPLTKEVTLTAAGSATTLTGWVIPTRNLDGEDEIIAGWIVVKVDQGGSWVTYASSWQGVTASSLVVPAAGPAVSPAQLLGTNSLAIRQEEWIELADEKIEMQKLDEAGADVIRTNMPWGYLETARGVWDPAGVAFFDGYFAEAKARGLKVIATFGTTPCWASSVPCPQGEFVTGYPPANWNDLTNAAFLVTARWGNPAKYGDTLYGIEVSNEPNKDGYQNFEPVAQYAERVRRTYTGIKTAKPSVLVGAGVLAESDKAYLSSLYAQNITGYYDAISVHPYNVDFNANPWATGSPLTPFSVYSTKYSFDLGVLDLHAFMLSKNDTKPMWITEFGFSTCQPSGALWDALCVTESQQSDWLTESFRMAARWPFVTVVLSFNGRNNDGSLTAWGSNFGLLRYNQSAKPSLTAVSQTWTCLRARTC